MTPKSRECALCGHRYIPSISTCYCSRQWDSYDLEEGLSERPLSVRWAKCRFRLLAPLWAKLDLKVTTFLLKEFR